MACQAVLPPLSALHQDIGSPHSCRGTVLDAELHIDLLEMLVHRARRKAEDLADIPVGFALGDPGQHFGFARCQREMMLEPFAVAGLRLPGEPEEMFVLADRAEKRERKARLAASLD